MSSSSTTIKVPPTGPDYSEYISASSHPGEHLLEDYLPDYDLTAGSLAKAMGMTDAGTIRDVVAERADLTTDLVLRPGRLFNQSPQMGLGLQTQHDLSKAAIAARDELRALRPLVSAIAAE